jgi:hypothetical protein
MADALTIDSSSGESFAVFCEQGTAALALRDILASGRFLSPIDALAAACSEPVRPSAPRIYTGYMPADQRRDLRRRTYDDGFRTAPRRATASDRARAEAQKWGLA